MNAKEKAIRFTQIKDFSFFILSIVGMIVFEKRIIGALSVDSNEIQQMS